MQIYERKKEELENLKKKYIKRYENLKRYQRGYLHCNKNTREKLKTLVCNFDNPDDVCEMERLTHALNAQEE